MGAMTLESSKAGAFHNPSGNNSLCPTALLQNQPVNVRNFFGRPTTPSRCVTPVTAKAYAVSGSNNPISLLSTSNALAHDLRSINNAHDYGDNVSQTSKFAPSTHSAFKPVPSKHKLTSSDDKQARSSNTKEKAEDG